MWSWPKALVSLFLGAFLGVIACWIDLAIFNVVANANCHSIVCEEPQGALVYILVLPEAIPIGAFTLMLARALMHPNTGPVRAPWAIGISTFLAAAGFLFFSGAQTDPRGDFTWLAISLIVSVILGGLSLLLARGRARQGPLLARN